MPLSLKVHWFEKIPGQQQTRLARVTPYARITREGHPPIYVQAGGVFSEGGKPLEQLPGWFDEEMARLTPKVREEVGWKGTTAPAPAPVVVDKPETPWTCPSEGCGETMSTRKKGMHIARHRKAERTKGV